MSADALLSDPAVAASWDSASRSERAPASIAAL
jgi:hypothetical protein